MTADRDGPLDKVLTRIERGLVLLSGLAIGAIMLVVVADVSMRYLFRQPLTWSYDLIGSYLMVGAFFLALSDRMKQHGHIAIDMFLCKLPHRFMHGSQGIGYLLAAVILLIIALQAGDRMVSACKAAEDLDLEDKQTMADAGVTFVSLPEDDMESACPPSARDGPRTWMGGAFPAPRCCRRSARRWHSRMPEGTKPLRPTDNRNCCQPAVARWQPGMDSRKGALNETAW